MSRSIKKLFFFVIILFFHQLTDAKKVVFNYAPKNWWVGMEYNNILVVVEGSKVSQSFIKVDYPGVKLNKIITTQRNNIVFLDITISESTAPGNIPVNIYQSGKLQESISITLNAKSSIGSIKKLIPSDLIYQIVIDRFSDGSAKNNKPDGYFEIPNSNNISGIHGGDIQGIINELKYIMSIGATAIELSPLYQSNQISNSYYHDEITDHYAIDTRLGTFGNIEELNKQCQQNNLKSILSLVLHQTSINHNLFGKKLFDDWTYDYPLKETVEANNINLCDPYMNYDFIKSSFYHHHPNNILINQESAIASKYLIQNSIWWIKQCKPDAIKIEKTQFNNPGFIRKFVSIIKKEYPELPIILDFDTKFPDQLACFLKSLNLGKMAYSYEYPKAYTATNSFSQYIDGHTAAQNLYQNQGSDFNYQSTNNQIVFIDNNSLSRIFDVADRDPSITKMYLTYLMTSRGIPSILYGSEFMLEGSNRRGVDYVRTDFALNKDKLNDQQIDLKNYFTKLAFWRKSSISIINGNTNHFLPYLGLYAVHKYNRTESVVVLFNNNNKLQKVNLNDCGLLADKFNFAKDPISGKIFRDLKNILLDPKSSIILELEKK